MSCVEFCKNRREAASLANGSNHGIQTVNSSLTVAFLSSSKALNIDTLLNSKFKCDHGVLLVFQSGMKYFVTFLQNTTFY